jgi:gliding motility-associated lipoprotein GldH
MNEFLFDASSGEPFGNSGLGDIYDHQFLLLKDYQFKKPGKYVMTFEQLMRTDTLQGVLAVGLRIERSPEKK